MFAAAPQPCRCSLHHSHIDEEQHTSVRSLANASLWTQRTSDNMLSTKPLRICLSVSCHPLRALSMATRTTSMDRIHERNPSLKPVESCLRQSHHQIEAHKKLFSAVVPLRLCPFVGEPSTPGPLWPLGKGASVGFFREYPGHHDDLPLRGPNDQPLLRRYFSALPALLKHLVPATLSYPF